MFQILPCHLWFLLSETFSKLRFYYLFKMPRLYLWFRFLILS